MKFSDSIKAIRQRRNLTQAAFAEKLNVTRQAVSNWENDKNLPDIEMLIRMSDVFDVSLDLLIKGETEMNNMTEKVIQDGSETKRAKYNMISTSIGAGMMLFGVIMLLIKAMSVEYIDAEGILHENFFLLPIGFLFLFAGLIVFIAVSIKTLIRKIKNQ